MATAVASRFAVLCDDVDDDYSTRKRRPQVPQPKKPETGTKATPGAAKTTNGKKKKNKENAQAQSTKAKPKTENSVKKKKKPEVTPEQWEEWKNKDEQLVNVNYEDDLTRALLMSKIEFEKKKELMEAIKSHLPASSSAQPTDVETKKGKKKKTIKVLSVEEFHNLGKAKSREDSPNMVENGSAKEDPDFFKVLEDEVSKEIAKAKKPPKKQPVVRQPLDQEALTLAQVRDKLDKKIEEAESLKEENLALKEELKGVKTRNKTLCHILANGEMKDKAQILMELERLQTVRDELSEQVASLAAQLEQERSRVRSLTTEPKSKDKNKKRTASSGDH